MTFMISTTAALADPDAGPKHSRSSHCPLASARLPNGMDMLVLPDHRAPVATHMLWYRNGAVDDPVGKSGIAHFLEHLMFKGTQNAAPGDYGNKIAAVGGHENAFTSWAYTSYFQRVPVDLLDLCMTYEADRMVNLLITQEQVEAEREVVLAERGMVVDSNPPARLREAMFATAFAGHPNARPIIGWREEIERLGRGDALAYYRRFYRPSNAILVVAGDVDPQAVFEMAARIYGKIADTAEERGEQVQLGQTAWPTEQKIVRVADADVVQPEITVVRRLDSPLDHPSDTVADELAVFLLGGDSNARLHQRLVRETGMATVAETFFDSVTFRGAGLAFILAFPADGVAVETLQAAIAEVIEEAARLGFDDDHIRRGKTQLAARAVFQRDSQEAMAVHYGSALATGRSIDDLLGWQARLDALSADDLLRAMARLIARPPVVAHLLPADEAAASPFLEGANQ